MIPLVIEYSPDGDCVDVAVINSSVLYSHGTASGLAILTLHGLLAMAAWITSAFGAFLRTISTLPASGSTATTFADGQDRRK